MDRDPTKNHLVEATEELARQISYLGFSSPGPNPAPGCLEFIGMQLRDGACQTDMTPVENGLNEVAQAMYSIAKAINALAKTLEREKSDANAR